MVNEYHFLKVVELISRTDKWKVFSSQVFILCLQALKWFSPHKTRSSKICDSLLSGEDCCSLIHWLNTFTHPMCCVHSCSGEATYKIGCDQSGLKRFRSWAVSKNTGLLEAVCHHPSQAFIDLWHYLSCFTWHLWGMVKCRTQKLKLTDTHLDSNTHAHTNTYKCTNT